MMAVLSAAGDNDGAAHRAEPAAHAYDQGSSEAGQSFVDTPRDADGPVPPRVVPIKNAPPALIETSAGDHDTGGDEGAMA